MIVIALLTIIATIIGFQALGDAPAWDTTRPNHLICYEHEGRCPGDHFR